MNTIQFLLSLLSTATGTAVITSFINRKKMNAEAENIISKTYQEVIDSLRKEIDRLDNRLNMQQARELEYLKIIGEHKKVETELRKRINELETQVSKINIYNEKST